MFGQQQSIARQHGETATRRAGELGERGKALRTVSILGTPFPFGLVGFFYISVWIVLSIQFVKAANLGSNFSFQIVGNVRVTNFSPKGQVVATRSAQFELKRHGEHWGVSTKDSQTGYVAESAFDGDATYCLFRNLEVLTSMNGNNVPWRLPAHFENGRMHSDVVNASILISEQPACLDFYVQAVWLGCIPNGVNVGKWQEPVVVPWSASLPGGISRFGAKPKWLEKSRVFPAELEFTEIKQSSEIEIGGRKFTFDGLNGMATKPNLVPLGTVVGRLQVLSWTNIGGIDDFPITWSIRRFRLVKEADRASVQEEYFVHVSGSTLDVAPVVVPAPGLLTYTVDTRMQTGGIPIAISYTLSNSSWLNKNDPRLATMLGGQAGAYLEGLQRRAGSSLMELDHARHSDQRIGWVRFGMFAVALGPVLVLILVLTFWR